MDARPVSLSIAGQSYKVISSASEDELQRLAETVSAKVAEVARDGRAGAQAVLLAAMALAHELEEERSRRRHVELRAQAILRNVLGRIDDVLGTSE
jgi:cell division protein ZapA